MKVSEDALEQFMGSIGKMRPHKFYSSHSKDIRPLGMGIIKCLCHNTSEQQPELKPSEIAKIMDIKQPTITPVIFDLEEEGFLMRRQSKEDRRVVYISLTEKGRKMFKAHQNEMLKKIQALVDYLGADDVKEFVRIAGKIDDYLTELQTFKLEE